MSQARPFLGKWQLMYVDYNGAWQAMGWLGSDPRNGQWDSDPTFSAHAAGDANANRRMGWLDRPVYWFQQNCFRFSDPATWHSGGKWLTTEPPVSWCILGVGFAEGNQALGPLAMKVMLTNPPSLGANPVPPGSGWGGTFSAWRMDDGTYHTTRVGWYDHDPSQPWVQCQIALKLVSPGKPYIQWYYNNVAPPGANFDRVDISGEDYSEVGLAGASFDSTLCPGTNFSRAVLSGATFSGAYGDMNNAIFFRATLHGTKFQGISTLSASPNFGLADLTGAVFTDCTLPNANFSRAQLSGCQFINCDLTGALFRDLPACSASPSFSGTVLDGADFSSEYNITPDLTDFDFRSAKSITGCKFGFAKLLRTNFDRLALTAVDFTGSDLTGTILTNTDLRPAIFTLPPHFSTDPANLTNMSYSTLDYSLITLNWSFLNLTEAVIMNLPRTLANLKAISTVFSGLQLNSMDINTGDFTHADLRNCDLSKSNLSNGTFNGAWLQGDEQTRAAVLTGALLENANFTSANLTGAQFSETFLWGEQVVLTEATVVRTDFSDAYLAGVNFIDVAQKACQGAIFERACLVNAVFNGADCGPYHGQPTSFAGACLQGADFRDASLDAADLTRAAVAAAPGSLLATIKNGWPPQPVTLPLNFATATLGFEAATDAASVCPNGQKGPCDPAKQSDPDAPTAWPAVGQGKR
jgi:uncharacterized protein YjbI with pentapeptide repeats